MASPGAAGPEAAGPGAARRGAPGRGAGSQDEVRRHNLGALLRLLHERGATSRSDLVAHTGLNRSTVGALTTQLAEAGLVRECAPVGRGAAGRPSIVVEPCPPTYALAVEIGVDGLSAARVGLGGDVLQRCELRQDPGSRSPATTVARVRDLVDELLDGADRTAVCVGLGVAVAGLVRACDGTVRLAPNLRWDDVPLARLLHEELGVGVPVRVGNEADLGARAEHVRGAGVGVADMIYLSGEVGLGGGIILGGQPLTGAGGYAGEVGHMLVNPRGRACRCGRTGCWETEIGEDAVLVATRSAPGATLADVFAAHAAGHRPTRLGLENVGRWLGVGVANLVNLLNPELIVFGGLTRDLFPAVEPVVRESLASALLAPRAHVRLELPGLGGDSNLIGAAELAFAPLLDDPLGVLAEAARRPVPERRRPRRGRPTAVAPGRVAGG